MKRGWFTSLRSEQLKAVARLGRLWPHTADLLSNWSPNVTGDCQGKAGFARDLLIKAGWPILDLQFHACDLRDGRRHGVLVIDILTDDGTVIPTVIDSQFGTPMRKEDLEQQYGYSDWCRV